LDTDGFETRIESLGPVVDFWHDLIFENPAQVFYSGKFLNKSEIYQRFRLYLKEFPQSRKRIGQRRFWFESEDIFKVFKGREIRMRFNGGNPTSAYEVFPHQVARCISQTLKVPFPKGFDDLDYLLKDDFAGSQAFDAETPLPMAH
jgi:hypothetical protein